MKISSMAAGATLDGTEKFEAVQSGATVSVTAVQLAELAKKPVVTTLTSSSGAVTVDLSLGDYFKLTPTENVTSWAFTNQPTAYCVSIVVEMGSTAYTVAVPAGLKWPGGIAGAFSTAANKRDELSIRSIDSGVTQDAVLAKDFS